MEGTKKGTHNGGIGIAIAPGADSFEDSLLKGSGIAQEVEGETEGMTHMECVLNIACLSGGTAN
ncbi:hypothetical protein GOP47_0004885 [Adiantum capillus-veneris]|uniref:Uncharacterized protein n=1 Tax=Adiantum capillus-veneris TaxID=13818 RepID=A0A9D4ZN42_ADICA|nr:hypothetical protein GOP47_0004885 [Adiantum capillus-veneris]